MKACLVTRKMSAASAAERWKKAYYTDNSEVWFTTRFTFSQRMGISKVETSEDIYNNLVALGPEPSPEDVTAVIGNDSWVSIQCNACDNYVDSAVTVGEDLDYGSRTAVLCKNCLMEAMEVMEKPE